MIIIILIVLFTLMAFTFRDGTSAASKAAVEPEPVKRRIYAAESGCMGLLFALIGMVAVLAMIAVAFPTH